MKANNSGKRKKIGKRKLDHLRLALSDISQVGDPGFEKYKFVHNALPEIDFDKIDTSVSFLGKKISLPLLISSMTGGVVRGKNVNLNLAKAAQRKNIPFSVGSQRAAIENKSLESTFKVRRVAPDILILANIGLVQLNYGFGLREFKKAVDMIEADALFVHLNPLQEVIQPEGNRNWENLLFKMEKIVKKLKVPVIAKEVGFGISGKVAEKLYGIGVRMFDTAGWGGTNWAVIEGERGQGLRDTGSLFGCWGIPTVDSIVMLNEFKKKKNIKGKGISIIGSGGIRTGLDVAKAISLGADCTGIAQPFVKASVVSTEKVIKLIEKLELELKISMFGVGAENIDKLKENSPILTRNTS